MRGVIESYQRIFVCLGSYPPLCPVKILICGIKEMGTSNYMFLGLCHSPIFGFVTARPVPFHYVSKIFCAEVILDKISPIARIWQEMREKQTIWLTGEGWARYPSSDLQLVITKCRDVEFSFQAGNLIKTLEDIDKLLSLETCHLRDNQLEHLDGFSQSNAKLKYINLR